MTLSKKNVAEFNGDVKENEGYRYTTNAPLSSLFSNKRISEAVNSHIFPEHHTLVDIGCGDGAYTAEFKEQFPTIEIEGFDPAADAISLAQKKYPDIVFNVRNILSEDVVAMSHLFDVGVIRGVLHHLTDQELAIRHSLEMVRTLIIIEPNGNNPILKIIEKLSPYHREHEEQSFSYVQLKSWCEKSGGKILHHEYIGFVPFFCPAQFARFMHYLQPILEKIPLIREYFSAQIVIVCKNVAR